MRKKKKNRQLKRKQQLLSRKKLWLNFPYLKTLHAIRIRCGKSGFYFKKGIKNYLTKEDLKYLWERDNAEEMQNPSIHRINNKGNYRRSNCQYVEREINTKGHYWIKENNKEKQVDYYSDCCNSPTKTSSGLPDFIGDKEAITYSFICSKCGKPCNIKFIQQPVPKRNKLVPKMHTLDCEGIQPVNCSKGKITTPVLLDMEVSGNILDPLIRENMTAWKRDYR